MSKQDELNYTDLSDMADAWDKLQELRLTQAQVNEAVEVYERRFKDAVKLAGAQGGTINGRRVFTFYPDGQFLTRQFCDGNPHLAAQYMRKVVKEEFDTASFKNVHPDLYQQWRVSSMRLISDKKKG